MKLKQIIVSLLIITIGTINLSAQPIGKKKPNKEKVKALKVAYITEKLDLSTKEAQQFWPIYNEFDSKMEAIHRELTKMHHKEESIDDMSDAEVEKMINTLNELRNKEFNIQKEYHQKFKKVLPIKKIAKLYKAEHDFKRDLLKKLKNHKGSPPPPRD